ncbi:hypothetical protein A1O7_06291 [Cladophialophora yegresii CBS 114405]|uniref:Uncharacterized protein n=1 Tax=Cladophialophora yegresii CBS 114405 TaxID=1182544 RepID=W9W2W2_9EURO|nr:uncharacterized protein A1O7_06291 [Cladophialophora yegresii CBS 114405]EXJ58861.1 hypothetical protein A1O7_06291 [Cladophialophora yegresii CBS 114405]
MGLPDMDGPAHAEVKTDDTRSFDVAPRFSIRAVDGRRGGESHEQKGHHQSFLVAGPKVDVPKTIIFHPDPDPSLGKVMDKFVGTFGYVWLERNAAQADTFQYALFLPLVDVGDLGSGLNTIFLPTNGFGEDKGKDNLLQINLTIERLQFMQGSVLGKIPNRGFHTQGNVALTGIPYQQTVSDRLNKDTGRADLTDPVAIHFEQGLFLLTPATDSPKNPATISRMASIPHGTAFTTQDIEPQSMIPTAPVIPDINIMPFPVTGTATIGKATGGLQNMTDEVVDKRIREPENLKKFQDTKVLTLADVNNPNQFLQAINAKKQFVGHWTFTLKSRHPNLGGGGVSNIAFLADGDKTKGFFKDAVKGNANATDVTCQYWVSIVKHKVEIPADDYTNKDATDLLPTDNQVDVPGPRFHIQVGKKLTSKKTIDLTSTQIQYSQNVRLDFGILAWPHVSVATLAPDLPIFIPSTHPAVAAL